MGMDVANNAIENLFWNWVNHNSVRVDNEIKKIIVYALKWNIVTIIMMIDFSINLILL